MTNLLTLTKIFDIINKEKITNSKDLIECLRKSQDKDAKDMLKAVILFGPVYLSYIECVKTHVNNKKDTKHNQTNALTKKLASLKNIINEQHITNIEGLKNYLNKKNFIKLSKYVQNNVQKVKTTFNL